MKPAYGDGKTYSGECLCHGIVKKGTVARSRPTPYTDVDMWTGKKIKCVMLVTDTGAHDVPLAGLQEVES